MIGSFIKWLGLAVGSVAALLLLAVALAMGEGSLIVVATGAVFAMGVGIWKA